MTKLRVLACQVAVPATASWHAFVTARAMENQCFILSLNRAGHMFGGSVLCPPRVDDDLPAQRLHDREEDFRALDLDTAAIHEARQRLPFLADRLNDYGSLACVERKAVYTAG